jgi:hypothetical protein
VFSNNGNYKNYIVRFTGTPYEVSYIGENIVLVTIWDKHEVALIKIKKNYVSGYVTNNVVVLSPEGTNCRQILTKSDGFNEPYSLRINIDRSELLVCNLSGPAFLFSLQYM